MAQLRQGRSGSGYRDSVRSLETFVIEFDSHNIHAHPAEGPTLL